MRIVDVQVKTGMPAQQAGQSVERRDVTKHRIDAVDHEPDALVQGGESSVTHLST